MSELAQHMQHSTGQTVRIAFADQGYTGAEPGEAARYEGIERQVVKLPEAKKLFVLLPRRWVVERSFGWLNRFRGGTAHQCASICQNPPPFFPTQTA